MKYEKPPLLLPIFYCIDSDGTMSANYCCVLLFTISYYVNILFCLLLSVLLGGSRGSSTSSLLLSYYSPQENQSC